MDNLQSKIERLQDLLESRATGGFGDDKEYKSLRNDLLINTQIKSLLPKFLEANRTIEQFWQFIKYEYSTYAERRKYIWDEFSKVLNYLEFKERSVIDNIATKTIKEFDQNYIQREWNKALQRKQEDPEGAITSSRTLIETTCKHILDSLNEHYKDDLELPKLYKLTAEKLNLAPDQHTEQIFKQILGGCQAVVEGLGALRNKLSDSHGKRIIQVRPSSRHAELAVNLAGAMTMFLLETYKQL